MHLQDWKWSQSSLNYTQNEFFPVSRWKENDSRERHFGYHTNAPPLFIKKRKFVGHVPNAGLCHLAEAV